MSRVDWAHRQAARASGNGDEKADSAVPSLPHVSPESGTWSSLSTSNRLHPEECYRSPGAPDRQSDLRGEFPEQPFPLHRTRPGVGPVSYTHLTLPTNREV